MANNTNYFPNPNSTTAPQGLPMMQQPYQYGAPTITPAYTSIFPASQGNVYTYGSFYEMNNLPVTNGISVGLCLSEEVMMIKTMQNGVPASMIYKLAPYSQEEAVPAQNKDKNLFEEYDARLRKIEKILENKGGKLIDV